MFKSDLLRAGHTSFNKFGDLSWVACFVIFRQRIDIPHLLSQFEQSLVFLGEFRILSQTFAQPIRYVCWQVILQQSQQVVQVRSGSGHVFFTQST